VLPNGLRNANVDRRRLTTVIALAITRDGKLLPEVNDFRYVELFCGIYFIVQKLENFFEYVDFDA